MSAPRKQCAKCPWRKGTDPHTIPNGYDERKHRDLKTTIASPGSPVLGAAMTMMACHETPRGRELPCVGWLVNQLGAGNNIALRLAVFRGNVDANVKTVGAQHADVRGHTPEAAQEASMIRDGIEVMPALTLRQPWAWAVVFGGKDLENRERSTNIRGQVVFQAAAEKPAANEDAYYEAACSWMVARGLARAPSFPNMRPTTAMDPKVWAKLPEIPPRLRLDYGVLYGAAVLVGVVDRNVTPDEHTRWKMVDRYAYHLHLVRPVVQKPWRGMPGWFYVPASAVVGAGKQNLLDVPRELAAASIVFCAKCQRPVDRVTSSTDWSEFRVFAECHGSIKIIRFTDRQLQAMDGGTWPPKRIEVFA